ncbi:O-antigen ligase family protein [Bacteroides thetaiotaomicron]|uniref:O-antigen ligase family protein n=1 Tax=Bacteroides thetaiotaomicron TaxID=818 RepID=UPI0034A43E2A
MEVIEVRNFEKKCSMEQTNQKEDRNNIRIISTVDSVVKYLIILITCIGALFTNSHRFVDSQIMPKWFVAIGGILLLFIYSICFMFFSNKAVSKKSLIPCAINVLVITVSFQALYGILQYFNVLSPITKFQVTGSFDNPAGFVASLVVAFPFFLLAFIRAKKNIRWGIACLSVIVVIAVFLSESRTGILSLVIILLCWGLHYLKFSFKLKGALVLIVSLGLIGGLYQVKKDSADGRLLIWTCSLEMIKDNWLTGYGTGGFEAHYMDYQADYFKQHPNSSYAQLADDVQYPFNEYLKFLINYGLIGFLFILIFIFVLIYCYYRKPSLDKRIAVLSLMAMSILSFFSYPTLYPFVWLIALLNISILLKEFIKTSYPHIIYICFLFLCTICSYQLYQRIEAELKWKQFAYRSDEHSLSIYEELEETLGNDRYFIYNYAVMLYNCNQKELCLQKALLCRKLWINYDLELLLGDIYREKKNYKLAENYYINASCMCPCRFFPLYQLYELYKETKNGAKVFLTAKKIMEKPAKINSMLVKRIKYKVKEEFEPIVN